MFRLRKFRRHFTVPTRKGASEEGNAEALFLMASFYPYDSKRSDDYFKKSADKGFEPAKKMVSLLEVLKKNKTAIFREKSFSIPFK